MSRLLFGGTDEMQDTAPKRSLIAASWLSLCILAVSLPTDVRGAEVGGLKAFATWQGRGQVFETGPEELTFVGTLNGRMYVESEHGPLAAGQLVCPAIVKISAKDGAQQGSGACTLTAEDGARVFATVTCTGYHLVGCDGEFTITGGTGRFDGISGGSPVIIRSEFGEIRASTASTAEEQAEGILYLPKLTYQLP